MSLPAPNLDDRTFQELKYEAIRRIRTHCPEWTDHNLSDPGITLIELFAWLTELTLYRLNQVPERNYIKFLELLGVTLAPATPAQTELHLRLSRSINDEPGEEIWERTLRAFDTVAATVRTETDEAVEFALVSDLNLRRPRLAYLLGVAAPDGAQTEQEMFARARRMPGATRTVNNSDARFGVPGTVQQISPYNDSTEVLPPFTLFSQPPRLDDAFYIGWENDLSGNIIALDAECVTAAATNLVEEYPSQIWESWSAPLGRWTPLTLLSDTTYGFNRNGTLELVLPADWQPHMLPGEQTAYWIRCRYTHRLEEMPPRPSLRRSSASPSSETAAANTDRLPEEDDTATWLRPGIYQRSPEIRSLGGRTVGGSVWASNCATVFGERLGRSDGLPGQRFVLQNQNLLPRTGDETLFIGDTGEDDEPQGGRGDSFADWDVWKEVANFAASGETDRHYTLDSATGELCLGPRVRQPDGSYRQHGAIPERGRRLAFRRYRHGGGTQGNVREEQISVLKSALPFVRSVANPQRATGGTDRENIRSVINPQRASGGTDRETIQRATYRALAQIQQRERAVTTQDFEIIAEEVTGVGRARCLMPDRVYEAGAREERIPPGVVRVLLVPQLGAQVPLPRPRDLRIPEATVAAVRARLDACRLLTTVLEVKSPRYIFISTDITLVADDRHEPSAVAARVRERLSEYLHPLTGGPQRSGWPFRRALTLSDIYAQVQAAQGVAFLLEVRLFQSETTEPGGDQLGAQTPIDLREGFRPTPEMLLCTREHRVQVRALSEYGGQVA